MTTGLFIAICYLVGMRVVGRMYFRRRHGVTFETAGVGTLTACMVGLLWPATILLPVVRNPELCGHYRHAMRRALALQELRATEALRQQRQG